MGELKTTLNPSQRLGNLQGEKGAHISDQLLETAHADSDTVLKELKSQSLPTHAADPGSGE